MKIREILNIINGELLFGNYDDSIEDIEQDARLINKGETFIAFKGESSDGNKYIQQAIDNGAKNCIVNITKLDGLDVKNCNIISVSDSQFALEQIIEYKLSNLDTKIVGVTGSVGKTSTREAIASVLSSNYSVFQTYKNYNGVRGLPLTCSRIKDEDIAVIEMGMDGAGQLTNLSKIVKPLVGVITNIGSSHIGRLGSRENILSAKMEILSNIRDNGFLILNADDDMLQTVINNWSNFDEKNITLITYGINNKEADFVAQIHSMEDNKTSFTLKISDISIDLEANTTGNHNIYNCLASIIVGKIFEVPIENIKKALMSIKSTEHRLDKFLTKANMIVYDDTYNASYESIKAAVDVITNKNHYGRKVYILGDVLELGDYSEIYHRKIGKYLVEKGVDVLITAGDNSRYINEEVLNANPYIEQYHFDTAEEIAQNLNILKDDDIILIKASHSMNFITIVKELKKNEKSSSL